MKGASSSPTRYAKVVDGITDMFRTIFSPRSKVGRSIFNITRKIVDLKHFLFGSRVTGQLNLWGRMMAALHKMGKGGKLLTIHHRLAAAVTKGMLAFPKLTAFMKFAGRTLGLFAGIVSGGIAGIKFWKDPENKFGFKRVDLKKTTDKLALTLTCH